MQLEKQLVVSKQCSLSPDADSGESKQFTIELAVPAGTTAHDMAYSILSTYVIKWQNANRKRFDKLVDGAKITLTYKKPVTSVDAMTQLLNDAKLAGIDVDDKAAMTNYIMSRINK